METLPNISGTSRDAIEYDFPLSSLSELRTYAQGGIKHPHELQILVVRDTATHASSRRIEAMLSVPFALRLP